MRKAKIVCTIGPASRSEEKIEQLILAGMDVARLNCSHGTTEERIEAVRTIRNVSQRLGKPVGIFFDLQGPRLRLGRLPAGGIEVKEGQQVTLATEGHELGESIGQLVNGSKVELVRVQTPYLAASVRAGQTILIDDGNIELEALSTDGVRVTCKVMRGGVLKSRKGINLPGARLEVPILDEDDLHEIRAAVFEGVDAIAVSFVRTCEDIENVRTAVQAHQADLPIIAKIERPEAIEHLDAILDAADAVMVARGDLGVEMPPEEVPILQKRLIAKANEKKKPVITATQMLESMVERPRPTRAEASDVANAIFDGTDALMLSAETTVGKYPVEAVKMMDRIVRAAEDEFSQNPALSPVASPAPPRRSPAQAIADAACAAADELGAKAIVVFTQSGSTALLVSKLRPTSPIVAFTPHEKICRRLTLLWGVVPKMMEYVENTDELIARMDERLIGEGLAQKGEMVVMAAGIPLTAKGRANFVKVHEVGSK